MSELNHPTKPVEVYQVIIAFLVLLGIVIGSVININTRITALEVKQAADDLFRMEMRADSKQYYEKLAQGQTEILIKLEGKADRRSN